MEFLVRISAKTVMCVLGNLEIHFPPTARDLRRLILHHSRFDIWGFYADVFRIRGGTQTRNSKAEHISILRINYKATGTNTSKLCDTLSYDKPDYIII